MNTLYVKLCGLTVAALPLLELELLDYIRGVEFRTFLAQSVLVPLLSSLSNVAVQALMNSMFGVI
ncbi:MAG: hypothetical protein JXQ73_24220 [Phycisphaerae bacterium]|nr:hypothetical protein [Phycisphaerae bacterium]